MRVGNAPLAQPGHGSKSILQESIKLVIWDLDDTFWKGTLSEGPIEAIPENIHLVQALARRGIISSICSKNDFQAAERRLRQALKWSEHEQREPPLVYDVVQPPLKVR